MSDLCRVYVQPGYYRVVNLPVRATRSAESTYIKNICNICVYLGLVRLQDLLNKGSEGSDREVVSSYKRRCLRFLVLTRRSIDI